MENKEVKYYTEEQFNYALIQQADMITSAINAVVVGATEQKAFYDRIKPLDLPKPTACVPVEKVKELITELERLSKRVRNPIKESVYIEHIGVIKEKLLPNGK